MGYAEEQYLRGWNGKGGAIPGPTATLLTIAQQIFKEKDFSDRTCFCVAELTSGGLVLATSGVRDETDKRLLRHLTSTVLPNGVSVEDSPDYRGVHPVFVERAGELSRIRQESRGTLNIGATGTGLCAEKKILTYCLISRAAVRALAVFAGPEFKFLSYQTTSGAGINYLYPCESCKSSYCEYIDMKLSGDTGYPMNESTGVPK